MTAETSQTRQPLRELLAQTQRRALLVGGAALILGAIGWVTDAEAFFQSYLLGFAYWWEIGVGCLGVALLHQLVGGAWGRLTRPTFAAGITTLPLLAVLVFPVVFGMKSIFPWAQSAYLEEHAYMMSKKTFFLNSSFFTTCTILYFAFWCFVGFLLNRQSSGSLRQHGVIRPDGWKGFSGFNLFAFFLVTTFASFHWIMSLDPLWYSAMMGGIVIVGGAIGAFCIAILLGVNLPDRMGEDAYRGGHHKPLLGGLSDMGTLLFAFILIWTYFSFSQFLIIWSANIPDEAFWYLDRSRNGWKYVTVALMLLHFGLPFFCLLQREFKADARKLAILALVMLGVRLLDTVWTIVPSFHRSGFALRWTDPVMVIAIGGLWIAAYCWAVPRYLSKDVLDYRPEPLSERATGTDSHHESTESTASASSEAETQPASEETES